MKKILKKTITIIFILALMAGTVQTAQAASAPAQVSLTVKQTASKTVTLTWKKVSGADGYEIYRKTGSSGSYTKIKTVTGGSTLTYKNTGLSIGKKYYYKVRAYDKQGGKKEVHNPSGLPDATMIEHIEEPYIKASIITAADYIGPIMKLCLDKRGELVKQEYVSGNRVELVFMIPLGEIVIDFYDKLKSISKGYASFDYHIDCFRPSKLAKLDILLNGEPVDALSALTHQDNAVTLGRRMCEKLKDLIPRQQFDIAIQAAIGAKIVARETIKCVRKDVTAKCYGGDVSRKRKLLEKQKKGKKRMKQIGNVEVPQKALLAVLKLD